MRGQALCRRFGVRCDASSHLSPKSCCSFPVADIGSARNMAATESSTISFTSPLSRLGRSVWCRTCHRSVGVCEVRRRDKCRQRNKREGQTHSTRLIAVAALASCFLSVPDVDILDEYLAAAILRDEARMTTLKCVCKVAETLDREVTLHREEERTTAETTGGDRKLALTKGKGVP